MWKNTAAYVSTFQYLLVHHDFIATVNKPWLTGNHTVNIMDAKHRNIKFVLNINIIQ